MEVLENKIDVCILGGGYAGLTLALQLIQEEPSLSITILERRNKDPKNTTHKVGESTVELGTYYLRTVLGLDTYLEENHLHKYGLRLFFSNENNTKIHERMEYGVREKPPVPSHQLDRGLLEKDLAEMVSSLGVQIIKGAQVEDVLLKKGMHEVYFMDPKGNKNVWNSKWVVDGTGRANILRRKLKLEKKTEHVIHASWFRVDGEIDVTDWSENEEWRNYFPEKVRLLSTVHFVGQGYWVWVIPLPNKKSSIGIVVDPKFHDFSELDTLEKAMSWLSEKEPQAAKEFSKYKVLNFRKLKEHSFDSKKLYSADRWGLIGEAANFLDAFYSPGADFIGMSNSWMCDLICSDFRKENIVIKSNIFDLVSRQLYNYWTPIYQDKYALFGNTQVMVVKIIWDFAVYWSVPCVLFTSKSLTNLEALKKIFLPEDNLGARLGELNSVVQQFFIDWDFLENLFIEPSFIDPGDIPFMHDLLRAIEETKEDPDWVIDKLSKNIKFLELIAAQIMRVVSCKLKGTEDRMSVNPYVFSLKESKQVIKDKNSNESAIQFDSTMAKSLAPIWLKSKE